MQASEALDVSREAIFVMLKIGGPLMLVALLVGLVISLIQALTQMQEMTLSFVPKIVVMFVALMFFLPFMLSTLTTFTEQIAVRISGG